MEFSDKFSVELFPVIHPIQFLENLYKDIRDLWITLVSLALVLYVSEKPVKSYVKTIWLSFLAIKTEYRPNISGYEILKINYT